MYRLLRAVLFLFSAETAHQLAAVVLGWLGRRPQIRARLRTRATAADVDLSVTVAGVRFPNPILLAAGFDKDATMVPGLFALGFGGIEVGTVTPRPQPGNPKPRMFRLPEHRALINRLGFNNRGVAELVERVRDLPWRPGPVGINLGRNKDTPNERAADDYVACAEAVATLADYVVVNASSPNTPGLRELQEPAALRALLTGVRAALDRRAPGKPLFLKIAPDLSEAAIRAAVDVAVECGAQGLIATNTTVSRPVPSDEAGGLSGAPLAPLSIACLRVAAGHAQGRLSLLAAGGVFDAEDAYERLRTGADAVQLYTGFIYGGPETVRDLLTGLAGLLRRAGFQTLEQMLRARQS
ncbi:MAG TPA: quinone-dependent dihydroorotate dehydrogenase [Myxococcaceae bacterium]|nr:quinone-dependent dihydroorotate dehydrogenase [Myxococcaceae bacterium]